MSTAPTSGSESAVATVRQRLSTCAFPGCENALDGRKSKYCSPRHKFADWDRLHPRLDFESYIAPRPLPEEPEARRDEQKAIAASNNRYQRAIARWAALTCFGGDPHGDQNGLSIVSDVRAWCAARGIELEWRKPWTGSLFHPCEWFEHAGSWRNAKHAGSNARPVLEWRLTAAGHAAYRAAKELTR